MFKICVIALAVGYFAAHACAKRTEQEKPYDSRERAAQSLTLEWMSVTYRRISAEFIQEVNTRRLFMSKNFGIVPTLLDPAVSVAKPVELVGYWTFRNTSSASEFVCTFQLLSVAGTEPKPGEINYQRVFVFRQISGTRLLLSLWYNSEGQVIRGNFIDLPRGKDYISPGLGWLTPLRPTAFVFLNGVSPFRLFDAAPEEWRLRSVSEDEWAFELQQANRQLQVRVYLSRRHNDAPSMLEIEHPNGYVERWRTLKFQNVEGIWFPSEVEFEATGFSGHTKSIYTLLRAERTRGAVQPILDDDFVLNRWDISRPDANEEVATNEFAEAPSVRWSELRAKIGR
mgnify:FL=1